MPTAKLVSSVFDSKFTNKFGSDNFKFKLEFDNGDIGVFTTIDKYIQGTGDSIQQTRFPIGKECEYDIETVQWGNNTVEKITPPKKVAPGQYTGRKADPNRSKRIMKNVSLDCAIRYKLCYPDNEQKVFELANIFYKWIESKATDEGLSISAQAALKMTITSIEPANDPKYNIVENLFPIADAYLNYTTT